MSASISTQFAFGHFPARAFAKHGLRAISPGSLVAELDRDDPEQIDQAVQSLAVDGRTGLRQDEPSSAGSTGTTPADCTPASATSHPSPGNTGTSKRHNHCLLDGEMPIRRFVFPDRCLISSASGGDVARDQAVRHGAQVARGCVDDFAVATSRSTQPKRVWV